MLHRRYFLSVIVITLCINYNIVAMGLFYGENSGGVTQVLRAASHITAFGNMIYQNRFPIGITAAVTVLATSYDKPIVMYSTLGACNAYLFYRCMRLEKNMNQLITLHEENTTFVKQTIEEIKAETSSLKSETDTLNENLQKIIPMLEKRIDPLAQHVFTLKDLIEANSTNVQKQEESIKTLTGDLHNMKSSITDLTRNQDSLRDLVATEASETRKLNTQNAERILACIQNQKGVHSSFPSSGLMGGIRAASFKPSSQAQS